MNKNIAYSEKATMSLQTLILDMESMPNYHAHYKIDSDINPSNHVIT